MTNKASVDVVIIGGGMVGAVCALLLAQANFRVTLVESRAPKVPSFPVARVSAFNPSSQQLLNKLGVWSTLNAKAICPFERLKVWDGVGSGQIVFDAAEVGLAQLGHIVTNAELVYQLWEMLSQQSAVQLVLGEPQALVVSADNVSVHLTDGTLIQAQLCIGADGAESFLRQHMPGHLQERSYDQAAIIAVIRTQLPHQYTGWQVFLPSGPLALLPLQDVHHCALVWSQTSALAQAHMAMSPSEFTQALNQAFGLPLGELYLDSERHSYPLLMRHASQYVHDRVALIGDAAHTIHPLAGQGANLGLMDALELVTTLQTARARRQDIGLRSVLRCYERARKGDNTNMILAMRLLHDLFRTEASLVVQARSLGLRFLQRADFLKNFFIDQAAR